MRDKCYYIRIDYPMERGKYKTWSIIPCRDKKILKMYLSDKNEMSKYTGADVDEIDYNNISIEKVTKETLCVEYLMEEWNIKNN